MLSKHPGRCRFPHGHSRRIDIVVAADTLDHNDMVCDFKALKNALEQFIDRFDHALAINSDDPLAKTITNTEESRLIVFDQQDPTTEVLAKCIYDFLEARIQSSDDAQPSLRPDLRIERVRVGETSSSWAEYTP